MANDVELPGATVNSEIEGAPTEEKSSTMDAASVNELVQYIMGVQTEPPKALDKMMTNLFQKLQMGLGYSVASNIQRQTRLTRFVGQVEEEIYNLSDEEISTMDKSQLAEMYKNASKALDSMNEFERRFLAQNKDSFGSQKTDQEKLAQKLMTLPSDKIDSIMKIIEGESQSSASVEDMLSDL